MALNNNSKSQPYDPEQYWDAKARHSHGDYLRAVCLDDPVVNRGIDRVQKQLLSNAMRMAARRLPPQGRSVLDYGCGTGRWVDFLQQQGFTYTGADISSEMLTIARQRYPQLKFAKVSPDRIPFADSQFDLIWTIAVIHHNPYPEQDVILGELARVLRPRGLLILFEAIGDKDMSDPVHHPRQASGWINALHDHGLTCHWMKTGRYRILNSFVERYLGTSRPEHDQEAISRNASWWSHLVDRVDAVADPYLSALLPESRAERSAMIFQK